MSNIFGIAFIAIAAMMTSVSAQAGKFTLSSPTIADGRTVPDIYIYNGSGYTGENRSPKLSWSGAPAGTESFAVTVFDPDAPHEGGWWHWLVFNIPPTVTKLPEGAGSGVGLPTGAVQAKNDFGEREYDGPAPPSGKPHRYIFTVYALKTAKIDLGGNASPASVDAAIAQNTLAKATITARYGR